MLVWTCDYSSIKYYSGTIRALSDARIHTDGSIDARIMVFLGIQVRYVRRGRSISFWSGAKIQDHVIRDLDLHHPETSLVITIFKATDT